MTCVYVLVPKVYGETLCQSTVFVSQMLGEGHVPGPLPLFQHLWREAEGYKCIGPI